MLRYLQQLTTEGDPMYPQIGHDAIIGNIRNLDSE